MHFHFRHLFLILFSSQVWLIGSFQLPSQAWPGCRMLICLVFSTRGSLCCSVLVHLPDTRLCSVWLFLNYICIGEKSLSATGQWTDIALNSFSLFPNFFCPPACLTLYMFSVLMEVFFNVERRIDKSLYFVLFYITWVLSMGSDKNDNRMIEERYQISAMESK